MTMTREQNRLYQYLIAVAEDDDNEDCLRLQKRKLVEKQKDSDFMEYSLVEAHLRRISERKNDRSVPVETTVLNEYNLKTGSNLENATIRYGAYSDELTRAYHATALTIGATVYFSTKAYKPETEEGRKTIAHELTHVAQHRNRPLADNRTKEELEAEAEAAEKKEGMEEDPYVLLRVGMIFSSDFFSAYNAKGEREWKAWAKMGALGQDMETYALYCNAAFTKRKALSILTATVNLCTKKAAEDSEETLCPMMLMALSLA